MSRSTPTFSFSMLIPVLVVVVAFSLFAACAVPRQAADQNAPRGSGDGHLTADPAIARAATYTEWFFTGQVDSLWASLNERGRARFPVPDSLRALRARVVPVLAGFERVLADSVERNDTLVTVWRFGVNVGDGATYYVRWRVTPGDHRVSGFSAMDAGRAAETPRLNYRARTMLRLPFDGEWIVFWGGRTVEENYHAAYPHQRFALDLVPAEDSVRLWRAATGVPMQLTDFACFGTLIRAPAAGRVIAALDTIPDNPIGQFHPTSAWGNYLVIEHVGGEYSLLAHLRQGSLQVSAGGSVRTGDVVAQCGNSGRTTAPHLHYDLIDRPDGARGTHSLPARFYNYIADSVFVENGEPRRWQRIRPAP